MLHSYVSLRHRFWSMTGTCYVELTSGIGLPWELKITQCFVSHYIYHFQGGNWTFILPSTFCLVFPSWMVCLYSQMCPCSSYLGYNTCGCIVHTCRLLYIGYGLVGLNNNPLKGGNRPQFSCVFIDPSGLVKDISVPFHLALRYVFLFISFMKTNFFLLSCWD